MKKAVLILVFLVSASMHSQAVLYKHLSPDIPYFKSEINQTRDTITFYSEKGIDKILYWNDIVPTTRVEQMYDGYKKVSICIASWPNANYLIYVSTNRVGITNNLVKADIVEPTKSE